MFAGGSEREFRIRARHIDLSGDEVGADGSGERYEGKERTYVLVTYKHLLVLYEEYHTRCNRSAVASANKVTVQWKLKAIDICSFSDVRGRIVDIQ